MRIYCEGTCNRAEEIGFVLTDLFLCSDEAEGIEEGFEGCLTISGEECETFVENSDWSSRWKGVNFMWGNKEIEFDCTNDLLEFIRQHNLALKNIQADVYCNCKIKISNIHILDNLGNNVDLLQYLVCPNNTLLFELFN